MKAEISAPASAGDADRSKFSLESLFRAYAAHVARWAALLGGPRVDVDDVVQEVFVVAHRRFDSLRAAGLGDAGVRAWLFRTTSNVVKRRRRNERIRQWLSGHTRDYADNLSAPALSPLDALVSRERSQRVHDVLMLLPARQRTVLILFELEGLSGEEVAACTGARIGTVWVQLHRARESFLDRVRALSPADREGVREGVGEGRHQS